MHKRRDIPELEYINRAKEELRKKFQDMLINYPVPGHLAPYFTKINFDTADLE